MKNLRKEPILLLLALGLCWWIWSSNEAMQVNTRLRPGQPEFAQPASAQAVIAQAHPDAMTSARDLFRTPSESAPLPPRELTLPDLAPIPPLRLPLSPGQSALAFDQLRWPEAESRFHEFSPPDLVDAGSDQSTAPAEVGDPESEYAKIYDKIVMDNTNKLWGEVLNPDKQRLSRRNRALLATSIDFDWFSVKSGLVIRREKFEPGRVVKIELAKTLKNQIEGEIFELPEGAASQLQRVSLVKKLLAIARAEPWVYEDAERLAETLVVNAEGTEEAHMVLLRVIRARGDLSKEYAYLTSLPEALKKNAPQFEARELGKFKARLGLWGEAEADLRAAIQTMPTDGRSQAGLARFLLDRGRIREALPVAAAASQRSLRTSDPEARYEMACVEVDNLLALGRSQEAQAAFGRLSPADNDGEHFYLQGAVAYASGDLNGARSAFERSLEVAQLPAARLGLGFCQLYSGAWDEAKRSLEEVLELSPTLRHMAQAGLALLYERSGHPDLALASAEAARVADPSDPYVLYMLGRQLRLGADYPAAIETLQLALELQDEFADACAEIAMALLQQSWSLEAEAAGSALADAARYADRLVSLDARASYLPYVELQGSLYLALEDYARAREALTAAARRGSIYAQMGLAVIDYRQNRARAARTALANMSTDVGQTTEVRDFARQLVAAIDDHASKEQVWDRFERRELGSLWPGTRASNVRPRLREGQLEFQGQPNDQTYARRILSRSGNFLSLAVDLQVGAGHLNSFAGLRLSTGRDDRPEFLLEMGIGRSGPQVRIVDGTPRAGELEPDPVLFAQNWDRSQVHRMEVAVEPVSEENRNQWMLVAYWDGEEVHRIEVNRLRPQGSVPMNIDLMVGGGTDANASFDNFRLIRRKEN
ncbi:MAG: tetratricopeptide repeat protein [Planctomycetota bacterium]|jgi:tetratricopeptide (TPR) repeat protein